MEAKWRVVIGVSLQLCILAFMLSCAAPPSEPARTPASEDSDKISRQDITSSLDIQLAEMEVGSMVFSAPHRMRINESRDVHVTLSLSESVEQLKHAILTEDRITGSEIEISDRMGAKLTGDMFDITPKQSEKQAVSNNSKTNWSWSIRPKAEGKQKLFLTLEAHLNINGLDTPRTIRTFNETIEVTVTAGQRISSFLGNYWNWLLAAIFIPIGRLLYIRRRNRMRW